MITNLFITFILSMVGFGFSAYSQNVQNDQIPPGKLFGEMSLGTNDVQHGLTQTDKGPSLHAGFGYRWTQFKFGFFGNNVRYSNSGDTMVLQAVPSYQFLMTNRLDLSASFHLRRSYNSGDHNDSLWTLDGRFDTFHLLYENDDQWEGTGSSAARIAISKDTLVTSYNLIWGIEGGYTNVSTDLTGKYFDLKTSITYRYGDINYAIVGSDSTAGGSFSGRGELQVYLQLSVLL